MSFQSDMDEDMLVKILRFKETFKKSGVWFSYLGLKSSLLRDIRWRMNDPESCRCVVNDLTGDVRGGFAS